MHINPSSSVCSLLYLGGFGEVTVGYEYNDKGQAKPTAPDFETFVEQIAASINNYNESVGSGRKRFHVASAALVIATTVSGQNKAEKYLPKVGFKLALNVPEYGKYPHGEKLWVISANELCRNTKEISQTKLNITE